MLLKNALEKLRSEVDTRKQKDLHGVVSSHLERLNQEFTTIPSGTTPVKSPAVIKNAISKSLPRGSSEESLPEGSTLDGDLYWMPFKMACQPTQPPKLRELALDLIQKLVVHKFFRGVLPIDYAPGDFPASVKETSKTAAKAPEAVTSPAKPDGASDNQLTLIDDIVHTVCMASPLASFNETQANTPETSVHLQIIKVLLTIVTAPSCQVHDATILKALQACINIFLYSKNLVNQTTAKAGLTQMCHFVFTRMESLAAGIFRVVFA
jgi:brefeldin A-inhibited guanine nucleotide-exchange protein